MTINYEKILIEFMKKSFESDGVVYFQRSDFKSLSDEEFDVLEAKYDEVLAEEENLKGSQ